MILRILEIGTAALSIEKSGGPMKESGVDSRPTNKESEKLRVASVARNIPSKRSEKHWRRSWRCGVRSERSLKPWAKPAGNHRLRMVNMMKSWKESGCPSVNSSDFGCGLRDSHYKRNG